MLSEDVPHFFKRCAVTRELYKHIVELRPSSTASGLEENVKRVFHLRSNPIAAYTDCSLQNGISMSIMTEN